MPELKIKKAYLFFLSGISLINTILGSEPVDVN